MGGERATRFRGWLGDRSCGDGSGVKRWALLPLGSVRWGGILRSRMVWIYAEELLKRKGQNEGVKVGYGRRMRGGKKKGVYDEEICLFWRSAQGQVKHILLDEMRLTQSIPKGAR